MNKFVFIKSLNQDININQIVSIQYTHDKDRNFLYASGGDCYIITDEEVKKIKSIINQEKD